MPTLTWLTREKDLHLAQKAPYRLLEHVPQLSYGDIDTDNMLIHGDNLDALKALLPYYAGKVKCIYVDPPFNTGGAFEHYDDNLEHSIWLGMMYPALELLWELLADDGAIIVNLDDSECSYCKVIMDEICGRKNYIVTITVEAATISSFKTVNIGPTEVCQYLLFYAKNKERFKYIPQYKHKKSVDLDHFSRFIVNIEDKAEQWIFKSINDEILEQLGYGDGSIQSRWIKIKSDLGEDEAKELVYEKAIDFALENSNRVFETKTLQKPAAWLQPHIIKSLDVEHVIELPREKLENLYIYKGRQVYFLGKGVKNINGVKGVSTPLSNLWNDIPTNNLQKEGGVSFPSGKKPEALLERVINMVSDKDNDIILDSFLGSGSTAAVAHKLGKRFIGIERGNQAKTHCQVRLKSVVDGEKSGISKAVNWQGGGGFRFYRLGDPVFDERGQISRSIKFPTLAAHIWFCDTKTPLHTKADSPLLGVHNGIAYYLLFNGILGDKRPDGGNVLTSKVLSGLPVHDGPKVIYGETSRLGSESLKAKQITFKQIPYDIKAR